MKGFPMRLLFLLPALLAVNVAVADERPLIDDTGRNVSVPDNPKRIVVLHEPLVGLPLMDLGLNLVGSYGRADDGSFITAVDFIDTVLGGKLSKPKGIGAFGQLDVEKVRALKPDLIVGTELDTDKVDQMSSVAPIYLQNASTGKSYGFGVEEKLAKVVGREDVFAARMADYLKRLDKTRKALPFDPAGQDYLAIFITDQLNVLGQMSGLIQALEDLGYERAVLNETGANNGVGATLMVPLNPEVFAQLNPDLLVIMNSYVGGGRDEKAIRVQLDRIVPGWSRFLKPEREGRVLYLDSAEVTTPTVASAEHALDAIEAWANK
tara:strand:+ start:2093 stop:3058 length:966 start_codon:yes stop_codon:yes gene_type:complete